MNGEYNDIDLYATLGVVRTATKVEIKKAYHKVHCSPLPWHFFRRLLTAGHCSWP